MLSYSHDCKKVYEQLTNDGYRVWLDREQMHGFTMIAMADAIEHSKFVLICMSKAYKQSANCQVEANYSFERRCQLIPLVMKPKY
jgi:hypothetical protein